jgi:hypothetical protein
VRRTQTRKHRLCSVCWLNHGNRTKGLRMRNCSTPWFHQSSPGACRMATDRLWKSRSDPSMRPNFLTAKAVVRHMAKQARAWFLCCRHSPKNRQLRGLPGLGLPKRMTGAIAKHHLRLACGPREEQLEALDFILGFRHFESAFNDFSYRPHCSHC